MKKILLGIIISGIILFNLYSYVSQNTFIITGFILHLLLNVIVARETLSKDSFPIEWPITFLLGWPIYISIWVETKIQGNPKCYYRIY